MRTDMEVDLRVLVDGMHAKDSPSAKEWSGCLRVKEINENAREITAVASAEIVDRDNEVVAISALKAAIPAYMQNPVVLAGHKHTTADGKSPVVGRVVKAWTAGTQMFVKIQFAPTPLGEEYWLLYSGKFQRALSIGFRVMERPRSETRDGKMCHVITALELYEISCVPVPANPAALSKSKQGKRDFVARRRLLLTPDGPHWEDFFKQYEEWEYMAQSERDKAYSPAQLEEFQKFKQSAIELAEGLMGCDMEGFDFDDDDAPGDDLAALVKGRRK